MGFLGAEMTKVLVASKAPQQRWNMALTWRRCVSHPWRGKDGAVLRSLLSLRAPIVRAVLSAAGHLLTVPLAFDRCYLMFQLFQEAFSRFLSMSTVQKCEFP